MGRRVNISTVLDLNSIVRRFHKSPELVLQIVLGNCYTSDVRSGGIVNGHGIVRLVRRVGFEPCTPELRVSSLEARETVFVAFIESKIPASAGEACKTEPLVIGYNIQRWVQAKCVES